MPRRELLRREAANAQLVFGAAEVRLERRVAPPVAPVVVLGIALERDARVVRGAAAHDPGAELRAVLAVGLPGVGEGELPPVHDIGRPAARVVRPVVRAGLDEADRALRLLAQPRGEHAAGGAAPDHDDVEPQHAPESTNEKGRWLRCSRGLARRLLTGDTTLVRADVPRADTRAGARLAGDRAGRPRPDPGADRLREDARGVPLRDRPAEPGARARPPSALRLAAEGAQLRHRARRSARRC